MESNFKKFVNDNKGFVVFFLIWFLLHLTFLLINWGTGNTRYFWPFGSSSEFKEYDFTEFAFYIIVPIVIWGLWKLIGKDVKEKISENN